MIWQKKAGNSTFAIDWVRLQDGKLFAGDGSQREDWFAFGAEVLAVADGTVVAVQEGHAEEVPLQPVAGVHAPGDYGGNSISIEIAPGVYAFYAHLQPDSITVEVGDQVTTGQVLGLLGNTGNSTAPHLHFGLNDDPDPLAAESLPMAFERWRLEGTIPPEVYLGADPNSGSAGPDATGRSRRADGNPPTLPGCRRLRLSRPAVGCVRHERTCSDEGRLIEVDIDTGKHEVEVVAGAVGSFRPVLVRVAEADHDPASEGMNHRVIRPGQVSARIEADVAVHDDKDVIMIRAREPVRERYACGMVALDVNHAASLDREGNRPFGSDRAILRPLEASCPDEHERPVRSLRNERRRD